MPVKLEVGKYFTHKGGRSISVLAKAETTTWGEVFVIEEVDVTGSGLSVAEISQADLEPQGWVEIGKDEWISHFTKPVCYHCGRKFEDKSSFVATDDGAVHGECFAAMIKERGSNIVKPVSPTLQ